MPRARVGDVELEYETFGKPSDRPMLLVMGLAYQMIEWEDRVCRLLTERGLFVIRFDNRDVGLSSKLDSLGTPDLMGVITGTARPPYSLDDMADDAVGVLDAVGVRAAHIVGISMGGMIAQLIAVRHPERVLSLTSIMSTVGGPAVVQPAPDVLTALLAPPGNNRQERVERSLATRRIINGAGLPFDEAANRQRAERAVDRSFHIEGALRQFVAIAAAPDRAPALGRLEVPVLIVHGEEDPLVPPENGRQTAAAIPSARLLMIPSMGHNLPERVWPEIIDAIVELTAQVEPREPLSVNAQTGR